MFFKMNNILFFSFLILGSIMAISSNSWFTSWLGLEINLMSMTPIILIKIKQALTESAIKYFMVQALSSLIMISSINLNMQSSEMLTMQLSEIFLLISLLIKSGAPPFHFWFPQIINMLNWVQCLLMFTWQKLAPLFLMNYLTSMKLIIPAVMATIIGCVGGLNQKMTKSLLAYSSISHSGWLIISSLWSINLWMNYFMIYSLISICVISPLHANNNETINHIMYSLKMNLSKYLMALNLLSLGGLPPLLGFTMKLSVLMIMLKMNMSLLISFFIIPAMISLYFYMRIMYSALMNQNSQKMMKINLKKKMMSTDILSILLNLALPLFYFIN